MLTARDGAGEEDIQILAGFLFPPTFINSENK